MGFWIWIWCLPMVLGQVDMHTIVHQIFLSDRVGAYRNSNQRTLNPMRILGKLEHGCAARCPNRPFPLTMLESLNSNQRAGKSQILINLTPIIFLSEYKLILKMQTSLLSSTQSRRLGCIAVPTNFRCVRLRLKVTVHPTLLTYSMKYPCRTASSPQIRKAFGHSVRNQLLVFDSLFGFAHLSDIFTHSISHRA